MDDGRVAEFIFQKGVRVGAVAEVGLTGQGRVWWLRTNGVNNKLYSHQY
jgi:hypothetical protein